MFLLKKPLEFTSGYWEVCLKKFIFAPKIRNNISYEESRVSIRQSDNGNVTTFHLNLSENYSLSVKELIKKFNDSVPIDFKDKILMVESKNCCKQC